MIGIVSGDAGDTDVPAQDRLVPDLIALDKSLLVLRTLRMGNALKAGVELHLVIRQDERSTPIPGTTRRSLAAIRIVGPVSHPDHWIGIIRIDGAECIAEESKCRRPARPVTAGWGVAVDTKSLAEGCRAHRGCRKSACPRSDPPAFFVQH